MGARIPGAMSGLIPQNLVKDLIEAEKIPLKTAERRKEVINVEKEEISKLQTHLSELDTSLNGLKAKADFYRLKVESSHPDIIDGVVDAYTLVGSYEFEVRGLAKAEKELAYGFPDKTETPVGFGYMLIEREDMEPAEVTINPGSTLQEVATQINDAGVGVKAMVINTKYQPDPYRLLVISEKSGKEAKILIDEDTTFLEFKEQVTGRNLDVLFEDVPVTDEDNTLEELVDGVTFFVKRSEPGTRIQVNITYDIDATVERIKAFVEKYNEVAKFVNEQFKIDPKTNKAGLLSGDGAVRSVMRQLQSQIAIPSSVEGKYRTLADIGITTDPKTGQLQMADTKVRGALSEDYDGVAEIFIRNRIGMPGVAGRLADRLKAFRDPSGGVIRSRLRGLDRMIKNQDGVIERKKRMIEQREEGIRRQFTALEGKLAGMQAQQSFLASKFGGGGGGAPANG